MVRPDRPRRQPTPDRRGELEPHPGRRQRSHPPCLERSGSHAVQPHRARANRKCAAAQPLPAIGTLHAPGDCRGRASEPLRLGQDGGERRQPGPRSDLRRQVAGGPGVHAPIALRPQHIGRSKQHLPLPSPTRTVRRSLSAVSSSILAAPHPSASTAASTTRGWRTSSEIDPGRTGNTAHRRSLRSGRSPLPEPIPGMLSRREPCPSPAIHDGGH